MLWLARTRGTGSRALLAAFEVTMLANQGRGRQWSLLVGGEVATLASWSQGPGIFPRGDSVTALAGLRPE